MGELSNRSRTGYERMLEVSPEAFGGLLGSLWEALGASWEPLGASREPLGVSWSVLGAS